MLMATLYVVERIHTFAFWMQRVYDAMYRALHGNVYGDHITFIRDYDIEMRVCRIIQECNETFVYMLMLMFLKQYFGVCMANVLDLKSRDRGPMLITRGVMEVKVRQEKHLVRGIDYEVMQELIAKTNRNTIEHGGIKVMFALYNDAIDVTDYIKTRVSSFTKLNAIRAEEIVTLMEMDGVPDMTLTDNASKKMDRIAITYQDCITHSIHQRTFVGSDVIDF
jgi:hypothetical protein